MMSWREIRSNCRWLPAFLWQRLTRRQARHGPVHLIIGLADHFEPAVIPGAGPARASHNEQERRIERWCRDYPKIFDPWRDADGFPFRHTYFYPAEQYDRVLIERLADHCKEGWGEIEVHLHHGLDGPDTAENTRRVLLEFRDRLAGQGCLSRLDGAGPPRYAFVHGNWALANSGRGRYCGVDNELQILSDTGCYADLTLPSAPDITQVGKINSMYECSLPLDQRAPHRRGRDLRCGRVPQLFPVIIQGPLALTIVRRKQGWLAPHIENGELTRDQPPTLRRVQLWKQAAVTVRGRPQWIFIKLHAHGMDPRDEACLLGPPSLEFVRQLIEDSRGGRDYHVHFVTAREMMNIALAACDGRDGTPVEYRDYRLRLITPPR